MPKLLDSFRSKINPPYSSKDLLQIGLTTFMLVVLAITVFTINQTRDLRSKAAGQTALSLRVDKGITGPIRWLDATRSTRCYGEDNSHYREWYGYTDPGSSLSVDSPFCTFGSIYDDGSPSNSGGTGSLKVELKSPVEQSVSITSPSSMTFNLHNLGTEGKYSVYRRCILGSLKEGGIWKTSLKNQLNSRVRDTTFVVEIFRSSASIVQNKCPEVDWWFTKPVIISPSASQVVSSKTTVDVKNAIRKATLTTSATPMYDTFQLKISGSRKNENYYLSSTTVNRAMGEPLPETLSLVWDSKSVPNGTYTLSALLYSADRGIYDGVRTDPIIVSVLN